MTNPLDYMIKDPEAMRLALMQDATYKKGGKVAGGQVKTTPGGPFKDMTWEEYRNSIGESKGGMPRMAEGGLAVSEPTLDDMRRELAMQSGEIPNVTPAGELIRREPTATPQEERSWLDVLKGTPETLRTIGSQMAYGTVAPWVGAAAGVLGQSPEAEATKFMESAHVPKGPEAIKNLVGLGDTIESMGQALGHPRIPEMIPEALALGQIPTNIMKLQLQDEAAKAGKAAVNAAKPLHEAYMSGSIPGVMSPVMNVVKPEGNLNFVTGLTADMIKGPETQTVESMVNQLKGKPGFTAEGLKTATENLDPSLKLTKTEFEDVLQPSKFSKADLMGKHGEEGNFQHLVDEAADRVLDTDILDAQGAPRHTHDELLDFLNEDATLQDLSPAAKQWLKANEIRDELQLYERMDEIRADMAEKLAHEQMLQTPEAKNFSNVQRLIDSDYTDVDSGGKYFELGVTHPSYAGSYRHYEGAPEGTIGHIRGSFLPEPHMQDSIPVGAGKYTIGINDPGAMLIEEIQSDAQKGVAQSGPLHQVHGTLFKAAVQHALENGAKTVYYPRSAIIADADRHKPASAYAPVYDQQIVKEGLDKLKKIPGVTIEPMHDPEHGVHILDKIDFSPEAIEHILRGAGQSVPGYKRGGVVKMAGGGIATLEPTLDDMRLALQNAPQYSTEVPSMSTLYQPTQGQIRSQMAEKSQMVPGQSLADFVAADYQRRLQNTMETPQRLAEAATGSSMGLDPMMGLVGDVSRVPSIPQMKAGLRLAGEQGIEAARPLHEAYMSGSILGLVDPALNVVKNKGGNWLPGSVEKNLEPLKGNLEVGLANELGIPAASPHMTNWIDKRLTPYIKNEMGTPGDPLRALAENDVLHYDPTNNLFPGNLEQAITNRLKSGNVLEGLGKSETAKAWETLTDTSIRGQSASNWKEHASASTLEKMPWIDKLDPLTPIYERTNPNMSNALGFDHLVDELRNATGGDVNIPQHLRIDPAKLERMSVPDAVNKVANINKWRMEQAGKTALETVAKLPEAMPSTDPKFTWRNLNNPEDAALSKGAHEAVGKDMGICIGGSSYIERAAKGEADHISLFDDKGHPHIAIESRPPVKFETLGIESMNENDLLAVVYDRLPVRQRAGFNRWLEANLDEYDNIADGLGESKYSKYLPVDRASPPDIHQIKGKGNGVPAPKYQEQLKQFLNSREWGDVKETGGLIDTRNSTAVSSQMAKLRVPIATDKVDALVAKMQPTLPRFITADDLKAALKPEGYAKGGQVKKPVSTLVNTKYNADDMRYALLQRKG